MQLNLIHSWAIPVSEVISPIKQCTLFFALFNFIEIAAPTAIGIDPLTIPEEKILYLGKHKDIEI